MTSKSTLTSAQQRWFPWLVCLMGAAFYCYEYYLRVTPSLITSDLMRTFHITGAQFGNVSAFYYYVYAPMQMIVGVLVDRFGPRRLLTFACLACVIGTLLFATAPTVGIASFGRLLIGFGSAFAFVGSLRLATQWLPAEKFAFFAGVVTGLGTIGGIIADTTFGSMVANGGWRHAVIQTGYIGLALIVVMFFVFRLSHRWNVEANKTEALPLKTVFKGMGQLLKNPQIWLIGFIGCLLYLPVSAFAELWGIPYLTQSYHMAGNQSSMANSTFFIGWMLGCPFIGWLAAYVKKKQLIMVTGSLLGLVAISFILYKSHLSITTVFVSLFAFGFLSSVQVLVFALAYDLAPPELSATAMALTNMFVMVGGMVFQPVIGWLLDMNWHGIIEMGVRNYSVHAYRVALSTLPLAFILASAFVFLLVEKQKEVAASTNKS